MYLSTRSPSYGHLSTRLAGSLGFPSSYLEVVIYAKNKKSNPLSWQALCLTTWELVAESLAFL